MSQQPVVVSGSATHVGRVRDHNEDALLVTDTVFVVADGMGGHASGEVASAVAVDAVRRAADQAEPLSPQALVAAVEEANAAILREVIATPSRLGMATTLTGIALVQGEAGLTWEVVNVGDSRVYRLADGALTQITQDHSEVADLVRMGAITPEEARHHPARNIVTRCLGRLPPDPVDTFLHEPVAGERWLVCSDGLTNELEDAEVASILGQGDDPQSVADALVEAAVEHGGRDNVTVVVVFTRGVTH